jgi:hypothetical protein
MNNMNLFQQFIYYFQQNGGYVFQQFFTSLFNFDLWRNLCCNCRDSYRDYDFT